MNDLAELEKRVLALPIEQRALLAESLLHSLPADAEDVSGEAELEEAERRDREVETGTVTPLSHDEFYRRVEAARKR